MFSSMASCVVIVRINISKGNGMNINKELADIGQLIASAQAISAIRGEVKAALQGKHAVVIGSEHSKVKNAGDFDVLVMHKSGKEASELITRRIRAAMPEAKIEAFDSLVDNVIGIRHARRGRGL